jgi:hypothetical protein
VVAIPSANCKSAALSLSRIERYKVHLKSVIAEAANYITVEMGNPTDANTTSPDENYTAKQAAPENHASYHLEALLATQENFFEGNSALKNVSDRMCALCRGGCCTAGGDHAFVTSLTIYRLMIAEPQLTADSILADYIEKLNGQVIEGGCVNQSPEGCVLPKKMRGDVCNLYYCDPLLAYQRETRRIGHTDDDALDPVVVVQRANNPWNRLNPSTSREVISVSVIDEQETRHLPLGDLHS